MGSDGPKMRRVLVGGGIGAGKSTLVAVLADRGFVVITADAIGAQVLQPGTEITREVQQTWPDVVIDGAVDRAALAVIVFSDPSELRRLESITHPAIREEIERQIERADADVVVEVPLQTLKLPGEWCRIAIVADESVRIQRAVDRGGNAEDVRHRIASQVSDDAWEQWADVVIDNTGGLSEGVAKMSAVMDKFLS